MRSNLFAYELPDAAIAQKPRRPRDSARLWLINGKCSTKSLRFYNLDRLLNPGDVLVVNDCKTVSGRIEATCGGRALQITFCGLAPHPFCFYALAKPAKKLSRRVWLGEELGIAEVVARSEHFFTLKTRHSHRRLLEHLEGRGVMPLPLYIRRPKPLAADFLDYQTHFARRGGGAATPTAALHFTPRSVAALRRKGVGIATVTLVVGGATFIPIRAARLNDHEMPAERGTIGSRSAAAINSAIKRKRSKIIAVGTTSLRLLEAAANRRGLIAPGSLETSIFIKPGYRFKVADMLLTNFHPPSSSALVLVSAICGIHKVKKVYAEALAHGLRFFSYGDCCLLEINNKL